MPLNVAVYLPYELALTPQKLLAFAPGADVQSNGNLFRRASRFEVRWDGTHVAINAMPPAELAAHLRGFEGFVLARCKQHDPKLLDRIRATRASLGIVIEPGADPRAEALVTGLARGGILFRADGVFDASGRPLATFAPDDQDAAADDEPEYPDGPPPGMTDEPDAEEFSPPPADRVARRARALGLVCLRGMLETDPGDGALLAHLRELAEEEGVSKELESSERRLLLADVGDVPPQVAVDASWRLQGVAVLAWALGALELPAHDDPSTVWGVLDAIGLRSQDAPAVLRTPRLRTPEELDWMGRRLLGIHWRMVDWRVRPRAMDFAHFAKTCWFGGFDLSGIPLSARDLAIGGRPIAQADPELFSLTTSIARERHQAINWLNGFHWIYSAVDTST